MITTKKQGPLSPSFLAFFYLNPKAKSHLDGLPNTHIHLKLINEELSGFPYIPLS